MSKIKNYAFIFKGQGYKKDGEFKKLDTEFFKATIVAVSSIDSACIVAKKLVENGVELIELCGGFDNKDLDKINKFIDDLIPIGLVSFDDKQNKKLKEFLGQ